VNADVVLIVGSTGECLATSRHVTRERPFTSMCSDVHLAYVGRRKRAAASFVRASEGFLTCHTHTAVQPQTQTQTRDRLQ